jgi:hypothetical protein
LWLEGIMSKIQPETKFIYRELLRASPRRRRAEFCNPASVVFCIVCIAILAFSVSSIAQTNQRTRRSSLELRSSDIQLVHSFNWAKQQALAYVFDGDPVGPWYEAALPGRRAFCMRDVSHQVAGAQALGLSKYTHNMLRRFAENISASRDWCSYWEIDYLNRPAPIDYKSDAEFWYNLPANFDVLDACYRMYLWTGDRTYIEDPVFLNFYDHTVRDYVSQWDLGGDRIMTRKSPAQTPPFFRGDPSYEESRRDMVLGVDLLATQYAGYRSYAAIQAIRGDVGEARPYLRSASDVKRLINTAWWNPTAGYFFSFLDKDHQFQGRADADLLYRDVAEEGARTQGAVDTLLEKMRNEPASEVEPESHYAEILYRYGKPEEAYAVVMDLSRPGRERQEYPEVSYSMIGAIVNGLMGINVEPKVPIEDIARGTRFETVVKTLPQLTAKTTWAELRNVPIGLGSIDVRHYGEQRTILTNHEETNLNWEAAFPGSFATLVVNGRSADAHTEIHHLGHAVTWVIVQVKPGKSASVEIQQHE